MNKLEPGEWSVYVLKQTTGIDGWHLSDNMGFVPTESEFEHMVMMVRKTYACITDEDVERYNENLLLNYESQSTLEKPKVQKKEKGKSGYIYLIKSTSGHYKIGQSKNPRRRLIELQKGATIGPFELDLICYFAVNDMDEAENYLHAVYHDSRINGEWFLLNNEQVEQIKKGMQYV